MELFLLWDPAQVGEYLLAHLDMDLSSAFIEHNIDGLLLPFVTTEHLQEIGIAPLATRLKAKQAINTLIAKMYTDPQEQAPRLNAININSNYVSMEAVSLCTLLLQDLSRAARKVGDDQLDMRTLNDNFHKLKTDLNPLIRHIKENKPLPTPTLDPGVAHLPTNSVLGVPLDQDQQLLAGPAVLPVKTASQPLKLLSLALLPSQSVVKQSVPLPRQPSVLKGQRSPSRRLSSGSVLSVGVGKLADIKTQASARFLSKPKLVDAKNAALAEEGPDYMAAASRSKLSQTLTAATLAASSPGAQPATQPLKQLKASSDDTCLKVLQHAMKRHHIPREKWSKYVLVVCYGDTERILKLTEKPVMIFKELQELDQNPTIMLRERADDGLEDSRIDSDIPGGTL